ncbi:N-acetylneuraminate synthase family protein [Plantibacter sp. YIM 135249]|uniref:N-acetylneuraminate synthase family protein n=1 Tax=Plantibacter sp. YIM 135249 TaxID=3423918 RepID=UPI003D3368BD
MIRIDGHAVGPGHPVYVIGEIGLNHNGDPEIAKRLIDVAADAGAQAVKFQKRTPEISTPEHMKAIPRSTPWGDMTYLDYRYRVEFDREQYIEIGDYATLRGLTWFASPWDEPSVDFLEDLGVAAYKIASASVTDAGLLRRIGATGKPVILSTGMSTIEQIDEAVGILSGTEDGNGNETGARRPGPLAILHATSTYPLPPEEANLRMIQTLGERFPKAPIGYSGHETGLQISLAAVAIGATIVERHITLDRAMWGSDHAASLEPHGFTNLVRDIRIIETAMGDGVKRIFPGEHAPLAKLRRVDA